MDLDFRFGQSSDISAIRDFVLDAGGGLFEFMLDRAIPGVKARHLIKLAIADPDSPLSYENALVAETPDGDLAGTALAYPSSEFRASPLVESLIPRKRMDVLRSFLNTRVENTLYLNTLAVSPWARGQQVGRTLLDLTFEWARERGFSGVSLHVWTDNEAAVKLYEEHGFEVVQRFELPSADEFVHVDATMLLMHASIADTPDAHASDQANREQAREL
jgi:ribosomal protein S18 acetylase RimI-like enzyme